MTRRDGDPEREAEEEAEVLDELELLAAHVEEHAVGEFRIEALDHHQLHVDELLDVRADLVGQAMNDVREALLHPLLDEPADLRRELAP